MSADDNKFFLGPSGAGSYPKYREALFECRLCGSKDFYHVQVTNRRGERVDTESWQCSGCSVVFRDWRSFTKYPGGRTE